MISYFDTSALVKKYNAESKSDEVVKLWNASDQIITSVITYAEISSVFGRKLQDKYITKIHYKSILKEFNTDWQSMNIVEFNSHIFETLKKLTPIYYLRGFDAVHLASLSYWKSFFKADNIVFACYDAKLAEAAKKEHFLTINDLKL